jgi:hypothetical protein
MLLYNGEYEWLHCAVVLQWVLQCPGKCRAQIMPAKTERVKKVRGLGERPDGRTTNDRFSLCSDYHDTIHDGRKK